MIRVAAAPPPRLASTEYPRAAAAPPRLVSTIHVRAAAAPRLASAEYRRVAAAARFDLRAGRSYQLERPKPTGCSKTTAGAQPGLWRYADVQPSWSYVR